MPFGYIDCVKTNRDNRKIKDKVGYLQNNNSDKR